MTMHAVQIFFFLLLLSVESPRHGYCTISQIKGVPHNSFIMY